MSKVRLVRSLNGRPPDVAGVIPKRFDWGYIEPDAIRVLQKSDAALTRNQGKEEEPLSIVTIVMIKDIATFESDKSTSAVVTLNHIWYLTLD